MLIKATKKKIKITKFQKCFAKICQTTDSRKKKDRTYYRFSDILEFYSINKKNWSISANLQIT